MKENKEEWAKSIEEYEQLKEETGNENI